MRWKPDLKSALIKTPGPGWDHKLQNILSFHTKTKADSSSAVLQCCMMNPLRSLGAAVSGFTVFFFLWII